jgi:hypothetical protein
MATPSSLPLDSETWESDEHAGMFSLDNAEGVRFLIRSRIFDEQEIRRSRTCAPPASSDTRAHHLSLSERQSRGAPV